MSNATIYTVYKIYYYTPGGKDFIAYIGRTRQPLRDRLRGHLTPGGNALTKRLSTGLVSRITYTECRTEADMNLYEIYEICREKPTINRDDKPADDLTVSLPPLEWQEWDSPLLDKWRGAEERRTTI